MDIHKEEVREKKLLLFNLRGEALILTGVNLEISRLFRQ